jgi:hypothetical protein
VDGVGHFAGSADGGKMTRFVSAEDAHADIRRNTNAVVDKSEDSAPINPLDILHGRRAPEPEIEKSEDKPSGLDVLNKSRPTPPEAFNVGAVRYTNLPAVAPSTERSRPTGLDPYRLAPGVKIEGEAGPSGPTRYAGGKIGRPDTGLRSREE